MPIKRDLDKLILRAPTLEELAIIQQQIVDEKNDRGAAILAALLAENSIFHALSRVHARFGEMKAQLFDAKDGLLSTFAAKVIIADCLGILGPTTRHNLRYIKHIRNTFAHARIPIDFSTPEVVKACNELKPISGAEEHRWDTPRQKYITACYLASVGFVDYASRCVFMRADIIRPQERMIFVPPSPLP